MLGVALVAVPVLWFIVGPAYPGGWSEEQAVIGIPISALLVAKGFAGMLIGLAWMWRIYRAPTRTESATWRYRDR